jgi:hypothetical protein
MPDGADKLSSCTHSPDEHTAASLGILLELPRECNAGSEAQKSGGVDKLLRLLIVSSGLN